MLTLSLVSGKEGEIMRFFEEAALPQEEMEPEVMEWICEFRDIHKAKQIMAHWLKGGYGISLWLCEEGGELVNLTHQALKDKYFRKVEE